MLCGKPVMRLTHVIRRNPRAVTGLPLKESRMTDYRDPRDKPADGSTGAGSWAASIVAPFPTAIALQCSPRCTGPHPS
jgi:hypothetical protein